MTKKKYEMVLIDYASRTGNVYTTGVIDDPDTGEEIARVDLAVDCRGEIFWSDEFWRWWHTTDRDDIQRLADLAGTSVDEIIDNSLAPTDLLPIEPIICWEDEGDLEEESDDWYVVTTTNCSLVDGGVFPSEAHAKAYIDACAADAGHEWGSVKAAANVRLLGPFRSRKEAENADY